MGLIVVTNAPCFEVRILMRRKLDEMCQCLARRSRIWTICASDSGVNPFLPHFEALLSEFVIMIYTSLIDN